MSYLTFPPNWRGNCRAQHLAVFEQHGAIHYDALPGAQPTEHGYHVAPPGPEFHLTALELAGGLFDEHHTASVRLYDSGERQPGEGVQGARMAQAAKHLGA